MEWRGQWGGGVGVGWGGDPAAAIAQDNLMSK